MKTTYTVSAYKRNAFFDERSGLPYAVADEYFRQLTNEHKDDPNVTVDLTDDSTGELLNTSDWVK